MSGYFDVTLKNLRAIEQGLIHFVGIDFFISQSDKTKKGRSRYKFNLKSQEHPLIIRWKSFLSDIEKSEQEEKLFLGRHSRECLSLFLALGCLSHIENSSRLAKDIRTTKYYSTFFEIKIASEYLKHGHSVEIQDENQNQAGPVPDFIITSGDMKFYVECKSLLSPSSQEEPLWNDVESFSLSNLENNNKKWNIDIHCAKEIDHSDAHTIKREIKNSIRSNKIGVRKIANDSISINVEEIDKLTEAELKKTITLHPSQSGRKGVYGKIEVDVVKFDSIFNKNFPVTSTGKSTCIFPIVAGHGGDFYFSAISRVRIIPFRTKNLTKRILAKIKDASKKIPKDGMGLIHIEVPEDLSDSFFDIIDNSFNDIEKIINQNHTRINAVILSLRAYGGNSLDVDNFIHYTIPNVRNKRPLPDSFGHLGSHTTKGKINETGTVIFVGNFDEQTLPKGLIILFSNYSQDNIGRAIFYHLKENFIRFEIYCESFGRRILTTDKPVELPLKKDLFFIGRWGKKHADMKIMDREGISIVTVKSPH